MHVIMVALVTLQNGCGPKIPFETSFYASISALNCPFILCRLVPKLRLVYFKYAAQLGLLSSPTQALRMYLHGSE